MGLISFVKFWKAPRIPGKVKSTPFALSITFLITDLANRKYGKLIHYNKFLISIRNSVLSEDDILLMRKNYKTNPYVEPEVLEVSKLIILSLRKRKSFNKIWRRRIQTCFCMFLPFQVCHL